MTINSHPVAQDGSVGTGTKLLTGPADDTNFPSVVDGIGPTALTGSFSDYWTTDVQVRQTENLASEVAAPRWCGGEGLAYNVCVLVDDARIARTSELGEPAENGDQPRERTITVSSLTDASTVAELGPYPDLSFMLGTASTGQVVIVTEPGWSVEGPGVPSTVQLLNVADGTTTDIGQSPASWAPVCAIGTDSVLGYTYDQKGNTYTAAVVGPAQVAPISWPQEDSVVGCSADGRFLYLQHIPQPPTEEEEDTEPPNPQTGLDRVVLADGTRTQALLLDPGVSRAHRPVAGLRGRGRCGSAEHAAQEVGYLRVVQNGPVACGLDDDALGDKAFLHGQRAAHADQAVTHCPEDARARAPENPRRSGAAQRRSDQVPVRSG